MSRPPLNPKNLAIGFGIALIFAGCSAPMTTDETEPCSDASTGDTTTGDTETATGSDDTASSTTGSGTDTSTETGNETEGETGGENGEVTSFHHCLKPATDPAPEDPYQVGEVTPTDDYGRFAKYLKVYGFTLVAKSDVPDAFLEAVRQTIIEMFPTDVADSATQAAVLRKLYEHRAVIPVIAGGDQAIDHQAIESIVETNSICDVIYQGVGGQIMEVIEHLLHFATDIGLHGVYPNEWGMTTASAVYLSSQEAQSAGFYETSSFSEIPNPDRQSIILQEFAFWIITAYWNLLESGPNDEWRLSNADALESQLPSAHELISETVATIMASPSQATLNALNAWSNE